MQGIPPELHNKLRRTLSTCGPFDSNTELKAIFSNARIYAWRDQLPEANRTGARINQIIDYLYPKQNTKGENALVLFLSVLQDQHDSTTACYRSLEKRIQELKAALSPANRQSYDSTHKPSPLSRNNEKRPSKIPIVVAVIGAIATITAAAIGIVPDLWNKGSSPTPTLQTSVTPPHTTEISPSTTIVPLVIEELGPVDTACNLGGSWSATLWVEAVGGNGLYTYYNNNEWVGGPTSEPLELQLTGNTEAALEGKITVESGGHRKTQPYTISAPQGCIHNDN